MNYCRSCRRNLRRSPHIRGYGHTRPAIWLGGEDAPYHLGIELEVSADDCTRVGEIVQWAERTLGHRNALDLKEDSSVAGFEIVTQPMTAGFFESVEWESFFGVLNETIPLEPGMETEPDRHGLHVHIGKAAFHNNPVAISAFCYLLAGDDTNLVRIARREPTGYCSKIDKPVSQAIVSAKGGRNRYDSSSYIEHKQAKKLARLGHYPQRGAINLLNEHTIEIRAGRSTRDANELRAMVRLVYVAAEYIRYLMAERGFISPKALHWSAFAGWVANEYPQAYASIANTEEV